MFDDIKILIQDAKDGRIGDAFVTAGNFSIKLGETYNAIIRGEKFAVDDKQFDVAEKKLAECCEELEKQPKGDSHDPKAIDPATILLIITTVLNAIKAFREWRKKRQES